MGGGVSTNCKSLNRIEISWLVQVLFNFYWFWGSPLWGVGSGGWVGGGGGGDRMLPHICTHMCMHTCTHMHAHIWHHRKSLGIPQKSNGGGHLHEIMFTMHACVCVCMHACMCMCMCTCVGGTPQPPQPTSTHPSTPRAAGSPKHQNSISLELIEIIQFCLKILYLWTLLNSYRL